MSDMLTDEQIRKHVATIVSQLAANAQTKRDEELVDAGAALFTSFMIALHASARVATRNYGD